MLRKVAKNASPHEVWERLLRDEQIFVLVINGMYLRCRSEPDITIYRFGAPSRLIQGAPPRCMTLCRCRARLAGPFGWYTPARARSLSDLGDCSEHGGRASTEFPDFEAHSGAM
jgi:hypothetical protein